MGLELAARAGLSRALGAYLIGNQAESLLRLAYGRLDPEHTPAGVTGDQDALDKLRLIFPGF